MSIERDVGGGWTLISWADWNGIGEPVPELTRKRDDRWVEIDATGDLVYTFNADYDGTQGVSVPASAVRELFAAYDEWVKRGRAQQPPGAPPKETK